MYAIIVLSPQAYPERCGAKDRGTGVMVSCVMTGRVFVFVFP
jgi:hypothetical protein